MNFPTGFPLSTCRRHCLHLVENGKLARGAFRRSITRGFSLVEVVLALGVTSFVLMALIGALPAGVKTVKDSMNDSARSNILQEIRGELEEVTFGTSASASDNLVTTLASQTNYYSPEGLLLTSTGGAVPSGAYYQATFAAANATIPGTTSQFQYESAQTITVTLAYPVAAPAANQTTATYYLLAAKQKSY
jgi:uncharacterized protein (TIGR02598 family)